MTDSLGSIPPKLVAGDNASGLRRQSRLLAPSTNFTNSPRANRTPQWAWTRALADPFFVARRITQSWIR